jgi:inorganic triphosphatase YgiF
MEIEAKYHVSPADLAVVAGLRALGPYTLVPAPKPELQENAYYDTADRRLSAAHHALRVRRIEARALITFKGPADVSPAGVHSRAEHEFPGDDPHPTAWPDGEARRIALALIGEAPLQPTVSVSTERQILHVSRGGVEVAELCLDTGVLRNAGREAPFTELEVELLPAGEPADLDALAAELDRHITLTPEPRGKLQRALELV